VRRTAVRNDVGVTQTDDPIGYVLSMNLHRRHLSVSQLGMVAGKAEKLRAKFAAAAKERQKLSKGRGKKGPANSPDLKSDSRDQLGEALGISGNTVDKDKLLPIGNTPAEGGPTKPPYNRWAGVDKTRTRSETDPRWRHLMADVPGLKTQIHRFYRCVISTQARQFVCGVKAAIRGSTGSDGPRGGFYGTDFQRVAGPDVRAGGRS